MLHSLVSVTGHAVTVFVTSTPPVPGFFCSYAASQIVWVLHSKGRSCLHSERAEILRLGIRNEKYILSATESIC